MITQRYNLNLIPDKVPVIVNCSQYDALSRTIEMVIFDGSTVYEIPSGTTATVRGTKQDNTGFEYPCTIDGSVVSFDIQNQMTIFAGRVPCEVRLADTNGIIGTCNFLLNVEETPLDPDVTISETDLPLLEEAEQNAVRAEQAAEEAVQVLSTAVKSVNDTLPDANGNVDIVALPTGGTADQVLVKQSSTDGDADWETAGMWHGDEVGDLPTPINADQLEGHPASYFQPTISGSNGINVANNTVSLGQFGTITIPSENFTNISSGTIRLHYLGPLVFVDFYTVGTCINSGTGWTEMFKLPSGFYPQERLKSACVDDSSISDGVVSMIEARVETTGEFRLYAPVAGHKYWGGTIIYFRSV